MIPEHYSRDIASRCQRLLNALLPIVERQIDPGAGGPLTTTFLVAISTPMILLPVERLYKSSQANAAIIGDDRQLDPELADDVLDVLGPGKKFCEAPFASECTYCERQPAFNIADHWDPALLTELGTKPAEQRARDADAARIITDLRNALAHGGVTYLDRNGGQTSGQAHFLAFVAAATGRRPVEQVNVLRIAEPHFRAFLTRWCTWLEQRRVSEALDRGAA